MPLTLTNADATASLGQALGPALLAQQQAWKNQRALLVFLHGELGAGKTTLVRSLIQGLGYEGPVRSPTYTLLEGYEWDGRHILHGDFYRLADPEELDYLGLRERLAEPVLMLIEWPQKAGAALPAADVELWLSYMDNPEKGAINDVRELRATVSVNIDQTLQEILALALEK